MKKVKWEKIKDQTYWEHESVEKKPGNTIRRIIRYFDKPIEMDR